MLVQNFESENAKLRKTNEVLVQTLKELAIGSQAEAEVGAPGPVLSCETACKLSPHALYAKENCDCSKYKHAAKETAVGQWDPRREEYGERLREMAEGQLGDSQEEGSSISACTIICLMGKVECAACKMIPWMATEENSGSDEWCMARSKCLITECKDKTQMYCMQKCPKSLCQAEDETAGHIKPTLPIKPRAG